MISGRIFLSEFLNFFLFQNVSDCFREKRKVEGEEVEKKDQRESRSSYIKKEKG